MLKKKCDRCGKKIKKKFDYCPWCGNSFKAQNEKSDYGMIGREDHRDGNMLASELKLPFGLNKMMNGLMKQLENELNNASGGQGPRGIKIKIQPGNAMQMQRQPMQEKPRIAEDEVSEKEKLRRAGLPVKDAESKLKRIGDVIIYELAAPGVKSKNEVSVVKLEQGIEIKVYTKNACYTKIIPLEITVTSVSVQKDKVVLEMKG